MTTSVFSFPPSDPGLLGWSVNFLNLITAAPTDYGLVAADATAYGVVHTAYATAFAACDPSVRSKPAVVAKNAARTALKNAAVLLINKINSDNSVTDAQKVSLGIPPRATPTPIPAPSTKPVLEVVSVDGWTVRIRLRDADGARRGKPPGVFGASVFSHVGETAPTDVGQFKFEGSTGRVEKIDIPFPSTLAAGTKVWICAFWFNGRKQSGNACNPVSVNLAGGGAEVSSLREAA